jgi:hypothetical protein
MRSPYDKSRLFFVSSLALATAGINASMLPTASERFPKGGALLMGLMWTAGTLSIQFVWPLMGAIFDRTKVESAGGTEAFQNLQPGPELDRVLGIAAQTSFRYVAILPAVLLIVFAGIWMYDRTRGEYRPTRLARKDTGGNA